MSQLIQACSYWVRACVRLIAADLLCHNVVAVGMSGGQAEGRKRTGEASLP